jgi:hypothetical protein
MAFVKIAAAILLVTSVPVLAVDLSAPIVGCSEVDCPTLTNTTSADCRVADRSFTIIGIANLNTSLDEDFTWTKGIETYDNVDPEVDYPRTYENNFYLGTPQGFDLAENATSSGYGACALFFTRVADEVRFEGDDPQLAVGTCSDAMNSDCVDALLKQATDVMRSNSSTSNSCQQLLTTFTDNLVSQCSQFATDGKWQGLKVQGMSC